MKCFSDHKRNQLLSFEVIGMKVKDASSKVISLERYMFLDSNYMWTLSMSNTWKYTGEWLLPEAGSETRLIKQDDN